MVLAGAKKAACLLMALDTASAAELLRGVKPEMVTAIAEELAIISQNRSEASSSAASIREFATLLSARSANAKSKNDFLPQILNSAMGEAKSKEIMKQVGQLLEARNPFAAICEADVADIAKALEGESAQVATLVLCELPGNKSAQLVPMLEASVRSAAVQGMMAGLEVAGEAKAKVASIIQKRLAEMRQNEVVSPSTPAKANQSFLQWRRVALLLRSLELSLRDSLLKSIAENDADAAAGVRKQMVTWEDLPLVNDRTLQNTLRGVDARKLALALFGAQGANLAKVRANISERAAAALAEETSLLSKPKKEDIDEAREAILNPLRELNDKGELSLEGA